MRMGLSQALFLMSACVLSASVCVLITNNSFTHTVDYANKSLYSNIDDVDLYLRNTGQEFQYLVTDMYDIIHESFQKDLQNMGQVTEDIIYSNLQVGQVMESTSFMDVYVRNVSLFLSETISNIGDLKAKSLALNFALALLADNIDTTIINCAGNCTPNLCSNVNTTALKDYGLDASSMTNLTDIQRRFDLLKSEHFKQIALEALKDLELMSTVIDGLSSDIKTAVNTSLITYYNMIHSLSDGVFKAMTTAFPDKLVKESTIQIFETITKYDTYRQWFGLGLTTIYIIIVTIIVIGMFLGTLSYNGSTLPTERSSWSHCGGNMLLGGVVVMFVVAALLMILTMVSFLFGAILSKSCEPLEDLTVFRDFLDAGKVPQFSLAQNTFGSKHGINLNLKGYDVLIGCRADKTPWTVFKMSKIVPLEQYIKYIDYLGNIGQDLQGLQTINIGGFKVLSSQLSEALNQLQITGIGSVNYTGIRIIASQPAVSVAISSISNQMEMIKASCKDPTKSLWAQHIASVQSIQKKSIHTVNQASSLRATILTRAIAADQQIQRNMSGVLLQASTGIVGKFFGLLDGYANEVIYLVYNKLGNCLPVWNVYKSVSVALCDYGVDSLNGYWFSLGWGLFFFIPIVIVAAMLAKHYKIMDEAIGYDNFDDLIENPTLSSQSGSPYLNRASINEIIGYDGIHRRPVINEEQMSIHV